MSLWVWRQRELDEAGVLGGRRVSPRRGKGLPSEAQRRQVQAWIADKAPEQLRPLARAVWGRRGRCGS